MLSKGMNSLIEQRNQWKPGVSASEVRDPLNQLYDTEDLASLVSVLLHSEQMMEEETAEDLVTEHIALEEDCPVKEDENTQVEKSVSTDVTGINVIESSIK